MINLSQPNISYKMEKTYECLISVEVMHFSYLSNEVHKVTIYTLLTQTTRS